MSEDRLSAALDEARKIQEALNAELRAAIREAADDIARHAGKLLDVLDELAADLHHGRLMRASDEARQGFADIAAQLRAIAERV